MDTEPLAHAAIFGGVLGATSSAADGAGSMGEIHRLRFVGLRQRGRAFPSYHG